jgi:hypothetical protein
MSSICQVRKIQRLLSVMHCQDLSGRVRMRQELSGIIRTQQEVSRSFRKWLEGAGNCENLLESDD